MDPVEGNAHEDQSPDCVKHIVIHVYMRSGLNACEEASPFLSEISGIYICEALEEKPDLQDRENYQTQRKAPEADYNPSNFTTCRR